MSQEKIEVFLTAMSMENSLLQSYRALFLALEGALIAAGFASIELYGGKGILGLGITGLVLGVMWVIVCHAKGRDVDRWRDHLLKVAEQGNLQGYFSYMKSKYSLAGGTVARYCFNWVMPIMIIGLWIWVIFIR